MTYELSAYLLLLTLQLSSFIATLTSLDESLVLTISPSSSFENEEALATPPLAPVSLKE